MKSLSLMKRILLILAAALPLAWSNHAWGQANPPSAAPAQKKPVVSEVIQLDNLPPTAPSPANPSSPTNKARLRSPAMTNRFELRSGDRVVFLGDTLMEREQSYGYLEAALTRHFPDRNVTFRNLGWSADTVLGVSRAGFDAPEKGFDRLKEQLTALKPTVVFLGYGMAQSFAGPAGVAAFTNDLNKLIATIQEISKGEDLRFVILSPIRHETLPAPLPDPAPHNEQLALYANALRELAEKKSYFYAPLFENFVQRDRATNSTAPRLTDNGIHLNEFGYWQLAGAIERSLRLPAANWWLGITPDGKARPGSFGMQTSDMERKDDLTRFSKTNHRLMRPSLAGNTNVPSSTAGCRLQYAVLKPGNHALKIDGQVYFTASEKAWEAGMWIDRGPEFEQAEELRQAILKKNELFFHRSRPENNTYLFLFRKHEQGQNAKEIPQFDPLIKQQEDLIAKLRQPRKHLYELVLMTGANAGLQPKPLSSAAPLPREEPKAPALQPRPSFDIDPSLEITLYAENPLLAKPIQMNFDPQGRLWVASSSVYPQIQPGQVANDKILVLEDTDGDGKAEKSTVFADGLLIPTGVEPGDGGVYVGQSTELLHFKDTDGDGHADERRVVLSGFGTEDTHHILHTLRWGHDGQLYMNQSIYIHSHLETPHGVVRLNSGGILNLRPPTMELGIHAKGFVNSWGHHFDEFGQSFTTDGAYGEAINYVVPQAMYVTYAGARRILGSVSPGSYPKFCSLEVVESSHFPDDWRGNMITCDFRAHRVVRFSITEQDSAYVTKEMPDIVRSRDPTFRPVDVKIGPDGALYIADWSNPIIQHGEVDFRDPRRDHDHGRIWRVTAKGRPLVERPKLVGAGTTALLDQLRSPNSFNRQKARRVLTERGTNILGDLAAWAKQPTVEKDSLEALWMYQSLDIVEPDLLKQLLSAKDGRIRAAAVRVLSFWHPRVEKPLDLLAERIVDEHPRVRLEALRALAKIPSARSAELALSAVDKPLDRHLEYALWLTINDLVEPWLAALQSGAWKTEGREKQLEFGLKSIEPSQASAVLAQLLTDKPLAKDGRGPWVELIGQSGGPKELRQLFDQVLQGGFSEPAAARALAALNQAVRLRNAKPTGDTLAVGSLFTHSDEKVRIEAVRLAGGWKELGPGFGQLVKLAGDSSTSGPLRQVAFESLRDIGGQGALDGLVPLCAKNVDASIRRQAVVVLSALKLDQGAPLAIAALTDASAEADALALWRSLLSIKGASAAITKALPKSGLPQAMAKAGLRAAREGGRSEPELVLALSRGADLMEGDVTLTPAEIQQMVSNVGSQGNAARGEAIYRRKELSCVACHSIGGAGGKVGPDMTSIGASAPVDYLIESVWFPNRKIKEGFHSIMLETKDGQEFSGTMVRENNEQLVIRDAVNKEVTVAKNNLANRTISNTSLMPAGLIDHLTPQERLDLFRFLSELGKPGPFDASKGNVARAWKLRPGSHDLEQFGEDRFVSSNLNGPEWFPAYSLVDGRLTADSLKEGLNVGKWTGLIGIYAGTQLQVPKNGPVRMKFSGAPGTAVWIDGKPASPSGDQITVDLPAGIHAIVVRLDPKNLPAQIRLESSDGTFIAN